MQTGVGGGGCDFCLGYGGGTVAFYRNNGTLDTSFGTAGESDFASVAPGAVAFQSNGQVIASGAVFTGGSSPGSSVLTRLNADGSLDTGFGQDGFADRRH